MIGLVVGCASQRAQVCARDIGFEEISVEVERAVEFDFFLVDVVQCDAHARPVDYEWVLSDDIELE
jgi:hypothetical protein